MSPWKKLLCEGRASLSMAPLLGHSGQHTRSSCSIAILREFLNNLEGKINFL